jgi:hypothetical protein
MGGAFGALGGDVTGVGINPAGLGVYRSSEINATMAYPSTKLESLWGTASNSETKSRLNFSNLSYVGYFPTGRGDNASSINFAFSYNRLKDFNRRYTSSAQGMSHSVTDYIAAITNGANGGNGISKYNLGHEKAYKNEPWLSVLGYQGYFINPLANDDHHYSSFLNENETVSPILRVTERGQIDNFDFSLATNFSDNFYIGGTLSLTEIDYQMFSYYQEVLGAGGDLYLDNYSNTKGSGYQFRLGAIWRPLDYLRLGVSYHSPTWYSLTDYYYGETQLIYETNAELFDEKASTPKDSYTDYRFRTPYSWTFSVAGVLGTQAVLSLDWELKDYKSMNYENEYGEETIDERSQNNYIDEDYRLASTLRLGLEYRFTPQFAGRLGLAYVQNPYESSYRDGKRETIVNGTITHFTVEGDKTFVTAGLGYRFTPQLYLDAAFVYGTQKDKLYYFSAIPDNNGGNVVSSIPAELKNNTYKGLLTLGYKF